ncbi:hypothetical protein FIV42_00845 [Persicimonas caeni]|uniref:Uncharacterized protein n=1 Tax=Persicimonas caeni TaxID=2292766 RepID=A0A4Y6PM09_PERCE|nr:hypothetical protein [Persicimonas caeni]QDG49331.1 hypothetical protein FIV42_00845 [Persicimonas caeni]QED30552.1 hypothetical protein FRD00_00840 [Persicimonas caeni]
MPTCKQCGTEFASPIWKLDAVDFMETDIGPQSKRSEKLRLDAGVFCRAACMAEYLGGGAEQAAQGGHSQGRSSQGSFTQIGHTHVGRLGSDDRPGLPPDAALAPRQPLQGYRQGLLDVEGKSVPYIVGCRYDGTWIAEIQLNSNATASGRGASEHEALANALSVITGEQIHPDEVEKRTG